MGEDMITELILTESVKSLAKSLVEKIVNPKIDKFLEQVRLRYKDVMIPRGEHFEEYLTRSYKEYSIINTLVFKNEQRELKDLYIPLTLKSNNNTAKKGIRIDSYPKALMDKYHHILITDTAGMGKTTLMKYMFLDVYEKGLGIPIFIQLRRLSIDRPILKEIAEQINPLNKEFDSALLLEFIKSGGFIFFLDGFDEVSSDRSFVTANIKEFVSKASENSFVLTSRPDSALPGFGDFQSFGIQPLSRKEAYELLRKYDKYGSVSSRLVKELKTEKYHAIDDFLTNPLLVSLLFAAYDFKQSIPLKKTVFYRQVYDAYFDTHDLSKGDSFVHTKNSRLDTDEFCRVLRHIAFGCLKKHKIEFDKDTLLKIISDAKEDCPHLSFSPSSYLDDLTTAVPLFCIDGQYYRWVHKSLMEYFAALYIFNDAKSAQGLILSTIYSSPRIEQYINLLDIYYDLDNPGFDEHILFPFLTSFITYYRTSYYTSNTLQPIDIEERICHLFIQDVSFVRGIIGFSTTSITATPVGGKDSEAVTLFKSSGFVTMGVVGDLRAGIVGDVWCLYSFKPIFALFLLLTNRRPDLFIGYKQTERLTKSCFKDDITGVDIHSCEDDPSTFRLLNGNLCGGVPQDISRYGYSPGRFDKSLLGHLDYYKCLDEVERIRQRIEKNSNSLDIVKGL